LRQLRVLARRNVLHRLLKVPRGNRTHDPLPGQIAAKQASATAFRVGSYARRSGVRQNPGGEIRERRRPATSAARTVEREIL
jgi:hypothetical protein